jgi:serine/threonine protein kinase
MSSFCRLVNLPSAYALILLLLYGSIDSTITITVKAFAPHSSIQNQQQQQLRSATFLSATIPKLDEWKTLKNGSIQGRITNHPSIPDGDTITTSPIERTYNAGAKRLVVTYTGSKYQLGNPMMVQQTNANGAVSISVKELQQRAKREYDLTGEVIGNYQGNQYLLAGRATKSTSGKSVIYKAFVANDDGLPTGDAVLVKISNNWQALEREHDNYAAITKAGLARGQFVRLIDYYPTASTQTPKFKKKSALVLERGDMDLRKYLQLNGPLEGKELRDAASAAAKCLSAVHTSRLVWTDMKTENVSLCDGMECSLSYAVMKDFLWLMPTNKRIFLSQFVVTKGGIVKGIDLESAMPVRDNPVDYSPEATPPEFAKAFLAGDGPYFVLEYNYDLWSYGMLLYEISTGTSYFAGKKPVEITKELRSDPLIVLNNVPDQRLRDLIKQCLDLNPRARPNILQVLLHPYFLTTGIGPISFQI